MTGRGRPGERWARRCNTAAIDAATTGPKGSLNRHGKRGKKIEGCGARKASCSRRFPFRHQFSLKQLKFLFEKRSWWDGSSRPVRGWWAPRTRDSNPFPSLAMQRRGEENKKEPDNNVQGISFPCRLQTRCSDALAASCRYSVFQPL